MGGWNPRDGMPFRGDSNTHTIETPRSRAHKKAEISRLENNFGCLGKPVNSLGSNCYLTPLLMMPLLTGVKMARFTRSLDRVLKSKPSKKNSGVQSPKPCSAWLQHPDFTAISAVVPAFTGYFSLKMFWTTILVAPHVVRPP
jgi:hypothetical protein